MNVSGRIYGSLELIRDMDNAVLEQLANVCMLPGIVGHALCMPDGHSGYGFPIGGVAAIDPSQGVISPGGIGFDINCGVRLLGTSLNIAEFMPRQKKIMELFFSRIPSGVGGNGMLSLNESTFDDAMIEGARWALRQGYAEAADLDCIEEGGCMAGANPAAVSKRARERGKGQIGSLGSGNHYLEIQVVRPGSVYNERIAHDYGITGDGQVVVMIHSGSRGFGHQVASDYLERFISVMERRYHIHLPDRELACAPFLSEEGQDYFHAMNCAINIAFLNRQMLMHMVRSVFSEVFKKSPEDLGLRLIYDVCHNTAKLEQHHIAGKPRSLLIHRKGATRAFGPGMDGIPGCYRASGQPVIIGGSMETGSYVLAGTASAAESFYSSCHGSGRVMSRHQAKRTYNGRNLQRTMADRGIMVLTASYAGLAEEAGGAYKDVDQVIGATEKAGLGTVVARMEPIGNIKG